LETYLYDTILYDSEIEENNIIENISSVEVYGKIPKRTLQIPFIDGSTYSPDFMYVVRDKNGQPTINLVVESKGVKKTQEIREIEDDKIDAATKLFDKIKINETQDKYGTDTSLEEFKEVLKDKQIKVHYVRQTNNENILDIINDLIQRN